MKKLLSVLLSVFLLVELTSISFFAYAASPNVVSTIKISGATLDIKSGSSPEFTASSAEPDLYNIVYEGWNEVGTGRMVTSSSWHNGIAESENLLVDKFLSTKKYSYTICIQATDPDYTNNFSCQFNKNTKVSINGKTYTVNSSNIYLVDFDGVNYMITLTDILTVDFSAKKPADGSKLKASLSKTSYTYDGKVKKPTVTVKDSKGKTISSSNYTVSYASGRKNVGKYSVKITFKGNYSGTKTLYFTIKPKGTTISSVSASSKAFTVKWKKQATQTSGYQIQYSTSSSFSNPTTVTVSKNSTTSKKVTKLKGKKKYYVRVRTYKTVSGTKYYSGWSSAKSVTTKK